MFGYFKNLFSTPEKKDINIPNFSLESSVIVQNLPDKKKLFESHFDHVEYQMDQAILTSFGDETLESSFEDQKKVFSIEANSSAFEHLSKLGFYKSHSFVIVMYGATKAGKSFITKYLIDDSITGPVVAHNSSFKPTSSNITFFPTTIENEKCLILDIEGKDALSKLPTTETINIKEKLEILNLKDEKEYCEIRNRTVEEVFPKLAYTSGNVVIYVTENDLGRSEHVKEISKIAFRNALNGIYNGEKPYLIIISNKQEIPSKDVSSEDFVKETTDNFLEIDEVLALKEFYENIWVFKLPRMFQESPETKERFSDMIVVLKKILAKCNSDSKESRKKKGILFDYSIWSYLMKQMIIRANCSIPVQMETLYTTMMLPDKEEKTTLQLLNTFVLPINQFSPYLVKFLAVLLVKSIYYNFKTLKNSDEDDMRELSKNEVNMFYSEIQDIQKDISLESLENLLEELDGLQPCNSKKDCTKCTLTKKLHYNQKHKDKSSKNIYTNFVNWLNGKLNVEWDGEEKYDKEMKQHCEEEFEKAYNLLMGSKEAPLTRDHIILAQVDLLQMIYHEYKTFYGTPQVIRTNMCLLCHKYNGNVKVCRMNHGYCQGCWEEFENCKGESLKGIFSSNFIQKTCPICLEFSFKCFKN